MNYFILSLLIICLFHIFLFKNNIIEANTTIYSNKEDAMEDCVDNKNNVNSTIIQGSEYALSKMLNNNTVPQYENTLKEYPTSCFSKAYNNTYNKVNINLI